MRIRKLELHGFKSFPDRTVLHFGSGIACVVGPNGCGKSNIVDAIKWCVGEQSAKSLRGDDMLDVIFAGSAERSAVPYAEVTLTFSTEGGEPLPGDYARFSEVSIGRRLHRNGTSEYLINQSRVRRKDLIELFLDTGIGNNLYSFVEQGRIGEIIHASAEKRRGLIDEAAGISRYKARRDEAQQELEGTAGQLDRAADVTDEMGRRVRVLETQVLRAAQFRRLRALIRQDELVLALARYAGLTSDCGAAAHESLQTRDARDAAEEDVCAREEELDARRAEFDATEQIVNTARDELAERDARVRELEGARGFAARTTADIDEELERTADGLALAQRAAGEAAEDVTRVERETDEARVDLSIAENELSQDSLALAVATELRRSVRTELDAREKVQSQASESYAAERARRDELDRQAALLPAQRDKVRQTLDGARKEFGTVTEKERISRVSAEIRSSELEAARAACDTAQNKLAVAVAAEDVARTGRAAAEKVLEEERNRADQSLSLSMAQFALLERGARDGVGVAERSVTERARQAHVEHDERVETARAVGRSFVEAVERRGLAWIQAVEKAEEHALIEFQQELSEAAVAAETEAAVRVDAHARSMAHELVNVEGAASAAARERLDRGMAEREDARTRLEQARVELVAADRKHSEGLGHQQEVQGRIRGMEQALADDLAREKGPVAVREAFPAARPLVDQLDLAEADEAWVAAVLDERLLVPVLAEASEVVKAAKVADKVGRATVLWSDRPTVGRLLAGVEVVETVEAALEAHLRTGRVAVVRGTGERVEADGLVRLGRGGAVAEAALRRRRELVSLQSHLQAVQSDLVLVEASRTELHVRMQEWTSALQDAEARLRAEEVAGRDAVRRAVEVRRLELFAIAESLAETLRGLRSRVQRETESKLVSERALRAADRAASQRAMREIVGRCRDEVEASVETLRIELAAVSLALRAEADVLVGAARSAGDEKIEQARQEMDAARAVASQRAETLSAEVAVRRLGADDARKARDSVEADAGAARTAQFGAEVALARAEADVQAALAAAERLRSRISELEQQCQGLDLEEQSLRHALVASIAVLGERQSARESATSAVSSSQMGLLTAEDEEGVARSTAEQARLLVSSLQERIRGLESAASSARKRVEEAEARMQTIFVRRAELAQSRSVSTSSEDRFSTELDAATVSRDTAQAGLGRERDRLASLRKTVKDLETALRETSERRELLVRRDAELDVALRRLEDEIEGLQRRMDERYQASPAAMLGELLVDSRVVIEAGEGARDGYSLGGEWVEPVIPVELTAEILSDAPGLRARLAQLEEHRQDLAHLGEVNLAALDEYAELVVRYKDLLAQRADLEASVESIRSAIAKMNRICRERFREAFDRVNENFQAAYPRLVGGGTARLSLTQEDDVLDAGVEIFVQPPGKRLQNLTLLSGGEKAMAAIALLLSLFQVKPSPFCLLDEVDAPLDEANGARFNEMLREMSGMSQFIVITHNRTTMEVADTLYGITMPKPGCSALVSVRLGV